MNHKKCFYGLLVMAFTVSSVYAAPTIKKPLDAGDREAQLHSMQGLPTEPAGPNLFSAIRQVNCTGFEAPDWDLNFSFCGDEFGPVCSTPHVNACGLKGAHATSKNCCRQDPNEETGWYMSNTSQHCVEPSIRDLHPATGTQHLRFQFESGVGAGFGGAQRTRAMSAVDRGAGAQELGTKTVYSYDIAWNQFGLANTTQSRHFIGLDGETGIFVNQYIYWVGSSGQAYVYEGGGAVPTPFAYWSYDAPDYARVTVNIDRCNNLVTYTYTGKGNLSNPGTCTGDGTTNCLADSPDCDTAGGTCVGTRTVVEGAAHRPIFSPPYGDYSEDTGWAVTDSMAMSHNHQNDGTKMDIDNFCVTHTACPDACCLDDGTCNQTMTETACVAAGGKYYPNVQCSQLGTKACVGSTRAGLSCNANADCPGATGPPVVPAGTCGSLYPPACAPARGSCCDAGPDAGGPGAEGSCSDNVLAADCLPPQKTWTEGGVCAGYATSCDGGTGLCSSAVSALNTSKALYCLTKPGYEPCASSADCAVPGFCKNGLCTPATQPGHCEYASRGFCAGTGAGIQMGRCSGSTTCTPSTGVGCCDPNCPTIPAATCPTGETCQVERQPCNEVPGGADCAFCEACTGFAAVACSTIGSSAECPAPFPGSPGAGNTPGTCVINAPVGCNGDADCPAQIPPRTCIPPAGVTPGGRVCTSDAQCVIPPNGPCVENTGACCNTRTGTCESGKRRSECGNGTDPTLVWSKGELCSEVTCVQLAGCCDLITGDCVDNSIQSACPSGTPGSLDQHFWNKGRRCSEVTCDAWIGACCDQDTFGGCTETIVDACDCDKCVWTKLDATGGPASCADIDCVHNEIPTVSQWGLVVLTLLLLTGAKIYFGRRQAAAA